MSLQIIIPTKNSEEHLKDCLEALYTQEIKGITIVDAHSTDRTREIAEAYGCEILDEPKSSGKGSKRAVACNHGIRNTESEYVGFIDSDVIVPEFWARDMVETFNLFAVGGVSSGCVSNNGTNLSQAISRILRFGSSDHAVNFKEYVHPDSLPGYNAIYPRSILESVGGFSEDIGGCEDWELNYRIRKAGWFLLGIPNFPVEHRERRTLRGFFKQMRGYGWSRGRLLVKKSLFTPKHAMPSILMIFSLMMLALDPFMVSVIIIAILIGAFVLRILGRWDSLVLIIFLCSWAIGYVEGLLD